MKSLFSRVCASIVLGVAMLLGSGATAAATTTSTCVDGTKRSNLSVTWNANDSVTVKTVGDKALCADTKLYFSSYTMPDNYDGTGFGGPTSYPQQLLKTETAVLNAGTNGKTTITVKVPESCKNMQIDLYYGPEITVVTAAGHGVQYISGKVLSKTTSTCAVVPPVVPVVPQEEAQAPATPAPQVVVAAPVTTLPSTGTNVSTLLALTGAMMVAGTVTAQLVLRARR